MTKVVKTFGLITVAFIIAFFVGNHIGYWNGFEAVSSDLSSINETINKIDTTLIEINQAEARICECLVNEIDKIDYSIVEVFDRDSRFIETCRKFSDQIALHKLALFKAVLELNVDQQGLTVWIDRVDRLISAHQIYLAEQAELFNIGNTK